MPTFSVSIKQEICNNDYDTESIKRILSSFLTNRMKISLSQSKIEYYAESNFSFVIRFITECLDKIVKTDHHLSYSEINNFNKKRLYRLTINQVKFEQLLNELKVLDDKDIKFTKTEKEKSAYVIGAFLSGGSISDISKPFYHLEIRSTNGKYLRLIQQILISWRLSPILLKRKYSTVLYIKRSTEVSDFLKHINAIENMSLLEDTIISRDFNNQLHRLNNLDISNISKSAKASDIQTTMIKAIINAQLYKDQNDKFKKYCQLRLNYPTASISELANLYQQTYKIKITRSGINHFVIKLKNIYKVVNK